MDELEKLSFDLYVRAANDNAFEQEQEQEEDLFEEPKVVDVLTYDTY